MTEALHVRRADLTRVAETYGFPPALVDSAVKHGRIVIDDEVENGSKNNR
jgi:alanyl-tRNA synthetase